MAFVKTDRLAATAFAAFVSFCVCAQAVDNGGWLPQFYSGLETDGSVTWMEKGYRDRSPAVRLKWETGAMKFGVKKSVTTALTGAVDWTVSADVLSEGNYGYAGAAILYYDGNGRLLGTESSRRPTVARRWRRISWVLSTPKSAKRFEVHLLSLRNEPIRFANMEVTSAPGMDKGDIPFEAAAIPAEWNKDWNGGEVRMMNFTDAPIPLSFYLKGDRKVLRQPRLEVDIPAELEVTDAFCPSGAAYQKFVPDMTAFETNGQRYVRHSFSGMKFMTLKRFDPASYRVDEGLAVALVIAPRAGTDAAGKSYDILYRTKDITKTGEKCGPDKRMKMSYRMLPSGLKRSDDFFVFSWNNVDRHFSSDAVAEKALKAYEAAGIRSFRRALQGEVPFKRKQELFDFYAKRPVKYIFSGRFGELWRLGACGIGKSLVKELGVRMAVSSDPYYEKRAKGKMCPQYFITDMKLRKHLRGLIHGSLSKFGVVDGDWVTFDMEPWHSGKWCRCEECQKAFAKFIGYDRVPSAEEIDGPLADKWAMFRCMHNEKSVEIVSKFIKEFNPTLKCVDYDYIMPYGDEEGMMARRRACAKDTLANEKWLDGHLCSYYHKIDLDSFLAMKNNTRHLKKFYIPMGAIAGYGGYLRQGEVLSPRQIKQFAFAAFVNGCPGYAFYSGVCFDGEILVAMMEAQDTIVRYEGLPWGKKDGKVVPKCGHEHFTYASTVRPDGTEVVALFNYDATDTVKVDLQGREIVLKPYETVFESVK